MQIKVTIEEDRLDALWRVATRFFSYKRVDPRKAWTKVEKVECVKAYVQHVVDVGGDPAFVLRPQDLRKPPSSGE